LSGVDDTVDPEGVETGALDMARHSQLDRRGFPPMDSAANLFTFRMLKIQQQVRRLVTQNLQVEAV
jgi:hypothetical protein